MNQNIKRLRLYNKFSVGSFEVIISIKDRVKLHPHKIGKLLYEENVGKCKGKRMSVNVKVRGWE